MQVPYTLTTDLIGTFKSLDKSLPLFADTETCGLYQRIRLLQLYQKGMDAVVLIEWPDPMQLTLLLNQFKTVWHNAHYDITTVQQQTSTRWVPDEFEDTFLLSRLKDWAEEKFSLDECIERTIGYCPYTKQGLDKKVLQKSKWDAHKLTKDQLSYAATDVYYMPELWERVKEFIDDFNYKLDMLTMRYCFDIQWNGFGVSQEKLFARYEENLARIEELAVPINVNSYKQVREYLGGVTESDALFLTTEKLMGNEKAAAILETRKLIKQNSFLDKFDTLEGRIYGKFKPVARSGRLTSDDQNLQQLPRKLKIAFEAPDGRALWFADYAQVELRTICVRTACRAMEKLFRAGEDVHGYTAMGLFGQDWTKDQRQLCKTYNFNLLYGGGIDMVIKILILQAEVLLDRGQANRDRRRWRNLWKEIHKWQERGIRDWQSGRPGTTAMGRRYKSKLLTDHLNIENQGNAADVFKLALHYMVPKLREYSVRTGEEFFVVNMIHDSFIIEGPNDEEHYEPIAKTMAESMQEAWFELTAGFMIPDLPMPVDVKVGTNWGEIEDDDIPNLYDYTLEGMALCSSSK